MKTLSDVETTLKEQMPLLQEQFKVTRMGIIGSLARGEHETAKDVDILVYFSEPIGAGMYLKLEGYLSGLLETEVNIVLRKGLSRRIAQQVLKEVMYVW